MTRHWAFRWAWEGAARFRPWVTPAAGTREPGYRPGAWESGIAAGNAWVAAGDKGLPWPSRQRPRETGRSTLVRTGCADGGPS